MILVFVSKMARLEKGFCSASCDGGVGMEKIRTGTPRRLLSWCVVARFCEDIERRKALRWAHLDPDLSPRTIPVRIT